MNMKTVPFNRDEWGFKRCRGKRSETRYENSAKFIEWVIKTLKQYAPRPRLEYEEKYNSTSLYLSPGNNEYLRKHILQWDWLGYSPQDADCLSDGELQIDIDEALKSVRENERRA